MPQAPISPAVEQAARAAYDRIYTGFSPSGFAMFKIAYAAGVVEAMAQRVPSDLNPSNLPALILSGPYAGQQGFCLGPSGASAPGQYAVSPDGSEVILTLAYPQDFGILVNQAEPARN